MKNFNNRLRKAFSMIELIFVIVVLAIVSTYYSDIITQVYKSYILQKAVHNANIKTTLVADQIANRIGDMAISREPVYRKKPKKVAAHILETF